MEAMKYSGVDWIGEIPSSWHIERVKYHFYNEKNLVGIYVDDYERLALTMKGVIKRSKDDSNGLQPEKFEGYQILRPNELVFKLIDLQNVTTSRVGLSPYEGLVSPAYIVLKSKGKVLPAYAEKYFMVLWKNEVFNSLGNDGVRSSLNATDLLNLPIIFPSIEEQKKIVAFLNRKCSKIDSLIDEIQKQTDVLRAYRESIIAEAVTRGIVANVKMASNRIPWVRHLPEHWGIIPAKYLFHNSDTRKCTGDEQLTASQKYGIITQQDYMERESAQIVLATQGLDNWKHVEPNDFIISLRSFQGGLEMSEIMGCITWHYVVLKASKPICHRFYKWLFKSKQYINALQGTCNFIRDGQDLRFSNFAQVPLYEPPIEEQEAIADYLDKKCAEIDLLIEEKISQSDTLEKYKKSLIYEFVTGKKEVPVV